MAGYSDPDTPRGLQLLAAAYPRSPSIIVPTIVPIVVDLVRMPSAHIVPPELMSDSHEGASKQVAPATIERLRTLTLQEHRPLLSLDWTQGMPPLG